MPRQFGKTKKSRIKKGKTYKRRKPQRGDTSKRRVQRGGQYVAKASFICADPATGQPIVCKEQYGINITSNPLDYVYKNLRNVLEEANPILPSLMGMTLHLEGTAMIYLYDC